VDCAEKSVERDHGVGEDRVEEDREHKQQEGDVREVADGVTEKGTGAFRLMQCRGGHQHLL